MPPKIWCMLVFGDPTCHGGWYLPPCSHLRLHRLWDRSQSSLLAWILNTEVSEAAAKMWPVYMAQKSQARVKWKGQVIRYKLHKRFFFSLNLKTPLCLSEVSKLKFGIKQSPEKPLHFTLSPCLWVDLCDFLGNLMLPALWVEGQTWGEQALV